MARKNAAPAKPKKRIAHALHGLPTTRRPDEFAFTTPSNDVLDEAAALAMRNVAAGQALDAATKLYEFDASKANALALVMAWKAVRASVDEIAAFDPDTHGMSLAASRPTP